MTQPADCVFVNAEVHTLSDPDDAAVPDRDGLVHLVRVPTGTARVGGVSRRVGVGKRVHLGVDEDAVGGLGHTGTGGGTVIKRSPVRARSPPTRPRSTG